MSERDDFPSEHPDDESPAGKTKNKSYTLAEIKAEHQKALDERNQCQKKVEHWRELEKVEEKRIWEVVKTITEEEITGFVYGTMIVSDLTKQAIILVVMAGVEHYERYY